MKTAGSFVDQAAAAIALRPGTSAHSTMSVLLEMAGMFAGATALKKTNIPDILGALSGRQAAGPLLLKTSTFISKALSTPAAAETLKSVVTGALTAKGIEPAALVELFQKISPLVGVDKPQSVDEVFSTLSTLANRVVNSEENDVHRLSAISVCPKCSHVYGIGRTD